MACTHGNCGRDVKARGLCGAHYVQWQRYGETWDLGSNPHRGRRPCTFPDCDKVRSAYGLCSGHAAQARRGRELRPLSRQVPELAEGEGWCSSCQAVRPIGSFTWDHQREAPYRECLDCCAKNERARRQAPAARRNQRRWGLERRYGINEADYLAMYARQQGRCAICGDPVANLLDCDGDGRKQTALDHCHGTGVVRGILCHGCNVGLGGFRDEVGRLTAAIEYLTRSTGVAHATLPG